jgi:hypothetical protein
LRQITLGLAFVFLLLHEAVLVEWHKLVSSSSKPNF